MITIDECMSMSEKELNEFLDRDEKLLKESIINECVDRCLRKYLNENTKYSIPKFLYHATPSCYLSSIKKNGLGAKIPRKRFWDYDNTEYANIKKDVFLPLTNMLQKVILKHQKSLRIFLNGTKKGTTKN